MTVQPPVGPLDEYDDGPREQQGRNDGDARNLQLPVGPLGDYAETRSEGGGGEGNHHPTGEMAARPGPRRLSPLLITSLGGLAVIAVIYVIYRAQAFYQSAQDIHPVIAYVYLAALCVTVVAVGTIVLRGLRKYSRVREVAMIQERIGRVTEGIAGSEDEKKAYQDVLNYVSVLKKQLSADTVEIAPAHISTLQEKIGRLETRLCDHRDAKRAIEQLNDFVLNHLDEHVDEIIKTSALRVATGTAIASGLLDSAIVLTHSIGVIRRVATLYAGRPGVAGTLRLLRHAIAATVFAEIAEEATEVIANVAAGAGLAKLGGRAAQGVGNGILIIRLGESARQQCRLVRPARRPLAALEFARILAKRLAGRKAD